MDANVCFGLAHNMNSVCSSYIHQIVYQQKRNKTIRERNIENKHQFKINAYTIAFVSYHCMHAILFCDASSLC